MDSEEAQPSEGCTQHVGETIQEYCETCEKLLCTQCLKDENHFGHKTISYDDFLQAQKMHVESQLHRLKAIQQRATNLQTLFDEKKKQFHDGYIASVEKVKSFDHVRLAMKTWRDKNESQLEQHKRFQLYSLDEAARQRQREVNITRPKIAIHKAAKTKSNIVQRVRELTPSLVISLSKYNVETALPPEMLRERSFSTPNASDEELRLERPVPKPRKKINPLFKKSHSDDPQKQQELEYVQREKGAAAFSHSNFENEVRSFERTSLTSTFNFSLGEHNLPSEEDETYVPSDLYIKTVLPKTDSQLSGVTLQSIATGTLATPSPSSSFDRYHDTTQGHDDHENMYDDMIPMIKPKSMLQSQPSPKLPLPPIPQQTDPKEKNDEYFYEEIEDISNDEASEEYSYIYLQQSPPIVPPALPPRPKKVPEPVYHTIASEIPYANVGTDAVTVTFNPSDIIASSCLAEKSYDSVDIYDVCTGPYGCMFFTDPRNSCIRVLMNTSESSKKMTKQFRNFVPKAIAYDHTNQRLLIATNESLNQLDFDENNPQKRTKLRRLNKNVKPLAICNTMPIYKGEMVYTYVTTSSDKDYIYTLQQNGDFQKKLEVKGKPLSIDYKDSYLVVVKSEEGCLTKLTPNGHPLWENFVDARQRGIIQNPFKVLVLPSDNIAVSESRANRVSIFSKEGKLLLRFGQYGSDPGMFNAPSGMSLRFNTELLVIDSGNKRVQIFSLEKLAEHISEAMLKAEAEEETDSSLTNDELAV